VSLRSQISLVLFGLLVLSVGATGLILIADSSGFIRVELDDKHRLIVENRAFALRHNLLILEEELEALAGRPELDYIDSHPTGASQALVEAVQNPDLYNNAVMLIGKIGTCLWSLPNQAECTGKNYADEPWFHVAREGGEVQHHIVETDTPMVDRRHKINIIQPIKRQDRFLGVLVGVIALGEDQLVTPVLRDNLPPYTEAILVDKQKRILYAPGRAALHEGWNEATQRLEKGQSGTLHTGGVERESLLAFAPVGADTPYGIVFRWPWPRLIVGLKRQMLKLALILIAGTALAGALGLWLSSYLTRPLTMLGLTARSVAAGQWNALTVLSRDDSVDEIGDLIRAFRHMASAIKRRDEELVTAAEELEMRVLERTKELAQAQEALINAERFSAMGKAAAAIAHELRNSMGGLGMAVELILADSPRAPRKERLRQQVLVEIDRLRSMIESLLSFARHPQLARAPQDLRALVERAIDMNGDLAQDRDVEVTLDAPTAVSHYCDGPKVQSAMINLIRNAIEVGRKVRVSLRGGGGRAILEIEDDGPGLSDEARRHLFEPFFTTKPNGTGLGLPTAKRFIDAHGGAIEVGRAEELRGARFVITLPDAPGVSKENAA
jgi:signal transduction histidine kinase